MANAVRSINSFTDASGRLTFSISSMLSMTGNSDAGSVASVKRLRPELTVARSPASLNCTLLPSGRARQISNSLRAGTVISPGCAPLASTFADISTSRSVPVKVTRSLFALTSGFDNTNHLLQRFKQNFALNGELHGGFRKFCLDKY